MTVAAGEGAIPEGYPTECEGDVVLADGDVAHLRPIRPDDGDRLVEFHEHLSTESIRRRFFTVRPHLRPKEVEHFTNVDYRGRLALVVESGGRFCAVARYERERETDRAEVAFVVTDAVQGKGIGTLLLEHLAAAARRRGIGHFVAQTLGNNHAMVDVFARAGFPATFGWSGGVVEVSFPIAVSEPYLQALTDRYLHAVAAWAGGAIPAPGAEVTEVLAQAARRPQAVVVALEVDEVPRPRRFFSLARVIAQRLPVVARVDPAEASACQLCRQAGVELATTEAELGQRAAELTAAVRAGSWQPPDTGALPNLTGCDVAAARAVLEQTTGDREGVLPPDQAAALLATYGITPLAGGSAASLWVGELAGRGLCLKAHQGDGESRWWALPLTDRAARDLGGHVAPAGADLSPYADVALRLTRLVDDQADLANVEVPLGGRPARVQLGLPRGSADDPFVSWLGSSVLLARTAPGNRERAPK